MELDVTQERTSLTSLPLLTSCIPCRYIYNAAQVIAPDNPWSFYLQASTDCWQGRVADLLERLRTWQATHPKSTNEALPDHDPRADRTQLP